MKNDTKLLWHELGLWSDSAFGVDRDHVGPIKHLKLECDEVLEDPNPSEFADCLLLLLDAARRKGMTLQELVDASFDKLEVNKTRQWMPQINGEPVGRVR